MPAVQLAILWHQHQPYYPNAVTGENPMPWVRLHGIKDYIGMVLHLEEVPEFHCTINLVPSLLEQIEGYAANRLTDRHLQLSRIPAENLTPAEIDELLEMFFRANVDTMIRPHPRFFELYEQHKRRPKSATQPPEAFSVTDLRDIQVWGNLCWFHSLLFERDPALKAFRAKQTRWTHHELMWLLDYEIAIMGEIIPRHRALQDRGQIEITTTPYFHPILPLLWDKRSAREAMPNCQLPRHVESYPEDVFEHLHRAVAAHTAWFGRRPTGLWPSEGSVSQGILGAVAEAGFRWLASDEQVLANSLDPDVDIRTAAPQERPPLYQPWEVSDGQQPLAIFFRDHVLSDLIGFDYQRHEPAAAANDLLDRVTQIGAASDSAEPLVVPIILDGENCWEYYPDGGVEFLRTLYREAVRHPQIAPVTMSEAIAASGPTRKLPRLFAGSWINHDFAIWIGHADDRRAWDLLHETRAELVRRSETVSDSAALAAAWRELYIAEGSDWFWWYGDDHSSELDALFDRLFREHLKNVYLLLDEVPPPALDIPIGVPVSPMPYRLPQRPLDVTIDGQTDFFEWHGAGHVAAGHDRGTMARVAPRLLQHLYFGFGRGMLFLRLDTAGRAVDELAVVSEVRIQFPEPLDMLLSLSSFADPASPLELAMTCEGTHMAGHRCQAALGDILEVAIPIEHTGAAPGERLSFIVDVRMGRTVTDRIPEAGFVEVLVPEPTSFLADWQA